MTVAIKAPSFLLIYLSTCSLAYFFNIPPPANLLSGLPERQA